MPAPDKQEGLLQLRGPEVPVWPIFALKFLEAGLPHRGYSPALVYIYDSVIHGMFLTPGCLMQHPAVGNVYGQIVDMSCMLPLIEHPALYMSPPPKNAAILLTSTRYWERMLTLNSEVLSHRGKWQLPRLP